MICRKALLKVKAMKILVVDDCCSTCSLLEKYLIDWGYEPVITKDGVEALHVITNANAPRLMIVDWMMPNMDGPSLIQQTREINPNRSNYIIMLTAKAGDEAVVSAFESGADDYLAKPIDADELYGRIREGENILARHDDVGQTMDDIYLGTK
jgi:DNA-binding response OmpR family regulator